MSILNVAQAVQAPVEDFTVVQSGGSSTRTVVGAGSAVVVLTGVVELGRHKGSYQGKEFENDEIELTFHIVGGRNLAEQKQYIEQGGKPIELTGVFPLSMTRTTKSKAVRTFNAMNYAKDPNAKHFKDFLGKTFTLPVQTELKEGTLRQKVDLTLLTAPINTDTGELRPIDAKYDLEELAKLFLWNVTNEEHFRAMWKTIENLDTYEKDGVTKGLDFTCDKIRKAVNYTTAPWYSYVAHGNQSYEIPDNGEATPTDELPVPDNF